MDRHEAGQEHSRQLLTKLAVLTVFVALMTSLILYFNRTEPDIKRLTLVKLAEQFGLSVTNAHWQWQAEGRPQMVMLVHYAPRPDEQEQPVEKGRRPIAMNHLGWPRVEPSSAGCGKLWQAVLNIPLKIKGFKVYAEYYAGLGVENPATSKCRFRLSVGPYFDYQLASGRVSKVQD